MSLKVKYIDAPVGAQEAAQIKGQGQTFSVMSLVASGSEDRAYATLEPEGWPLDGSRCIMPDDIKAGFWSTTTSKREIAVLGEAVLGQAVLGASVSTAQFEETPPQITMSFDQKYTASGISIIFSPSTEEWCTAICVTWFDGETKKAQETAYPTEAKWTFQRVVEGFNRITVELLRTNYAGHFAKIQRIEIGQIRWFSQEEITSVHIVNEVDPTLSELTVDTMQIDIHDQKGAALLPQKNQKVELYRDDKLYAVHYISSSSRLGKQDYTFSCQSAIGLLDDEYLGGVYGGVDIECVLADILEGFPYELDNSFTECKIVGYLPICTRREALQQIVFSIGAVVTTQGSSKIQIKPLPSGLSTPFKSNNIFLGGKVETEPRVARVEVVAHKYAESAETETLMNEEEISGGDVLVTFSEPHYEYSITGGKITNRGANWVTITPDGVDPLDGITPYGKISLSGKKYLHSTIRHIWRNTEATSDEQNNVFAVEEATLVHGGNVENVLNRLRAISKRRQILSQEVAVSDQQAGQQLVSVSPWGGFLKGYITSMESDLTSAGHTASVKILGGELDPEEFRYSGQLRSGDMEGLC